ncbi:hypothetical protein Emag_007347 [Eimeria magna]
MRLAPGSLGHQPQDVALSSGNTGWVRTNLQRPAPSARALAPPLVYLVAASTVPSVGLAIPDQLICGLIAISNTSNLLLHLSAGWPLAETLRLPHAPVRSVRLVPADPSPAPTDSASDTLAYEKVLGGFIAAPPSPNSCLLPAELQQLSDLLYECRGRFSDGGEPLPETFLLKARLDTGDAKPTSAPPPRPFPAMRQVVLRRCRRA